MISEGDADTETTLRLSLAVVPYKTKPGAVAVRELLVHNNHQRYVVRNVFERQAGERHDAVVEDVDGTGRRIRARQEPVRFAEFVQESRRELLHFRVKNVMVRNALAFFAQFTSGSKLRSAFFRTNAMPK